MCLIWSAGLYHPRGQGHVEGLDAAAERSHHLPGGVPTDFSQHGQYHQVSQAAGECRCLPESASLFGTIALRFPASRSYTKSSASREDWPQKAVMLHGSFRLLRALTDHVIALQLEASR